MTALKQDLKSDLEQFVRKESRYNEHFLGAHIPVGGTAGAVTQLFEDIDEGESLDDRIIWNSILIDDQPMLALTDRFTQFYEKLKGKSAVADVLKKFDAWLSASHDRAASILSDSV